MSLQSWTAALITARAVPGRRVSLLAHFRHEGRSCACRYEGWTSAQAQSGWVDIPVGVGARFRFGRAKALIIPLLGPQLLEVLTEVM